MSSPLVEVQPGIWVRGEGIMKYGHDDFNYEWSDDLRVTATCKHCGEQGMMPLMEGHDRAHAEKHATVLLPHTSLCSLAKAAAGAG